MSGGGGSSTTTQKADPWSGLQPSLSRLYAGADTAYQTPMQAFPGSVYAPMSGDTSKAIAMQEQRARAGSPVTGAMQDNLTDTLQGDYLYSNPAFSFLGATANGDMLNSNPFVDRMFDQAAGKVNANLAGQFAGSGRYGSGAQLVANSDALNNLATQIYGGNYAQERQNQLAAASALGGAYDTARQQQMQANLFAPAAANQDYFDIAKLAEAGAQREAFSQQDIDNQRRLFEFSQMEPWQRAQLYNNILTGGMALNGSTGTTTQPRGSLGAGMIGGGLGGAATGAMIGSVVPGIGTAVGAGVGGLLGLVGGGLSR